jgi:hypothetical protein
VEFVLVVAITAGIIGLAGRLPDPRKVKRELARARIETIESLAEGKAAAVRGTVEPLDALLVSPLTEQRCVYWLVVFDEVGLAGKYSELGRVEQGAPFLLRSEAGAARVVPDRPRVALPSRAFSRPMMYAQDLIQLAGGTLKRPTYPTSWLRATVYALEPGALVTVRGWCTREPDPQASEQVSGYREQLPTRPVLSGSRRVRMLIG